MTKLDEKLESQKDKKDQDTTINNLKEISTTFTNERDWGQFNNAKDLATSLVVEASELLDIFTWKNSKEVEDLFKNEKKKSEIEDEMSDVLYLLLELSTQYDLDISTAFRKKMIQNAEKYPIEKAKGVATKYNEL